MKIIKEGDPKFRIFPIRWECKKCLSVVDYDRADVDINQFPNGNNGKKSYLLDVQCPYCCRCHAIRLTVSDKGYDLKEV